MPKDGDAVLTEVGEQPLRMAVEITHQCNLRCQHCSADSGADGRALTVDEWKGVIDQIAGFEVAYLAFSGGEPLLHPQVLELLGYAAAKPGIEMVNVATNGLLVTEEMVDDLRDVGVFALGISIDSDDPDAHDRFRGVAGAWRRTTDAVRRLARRGCFQVGVHPVITTMNYSRMRQLVELAESLGAGVFSTQRFLPVGRGGRARHLLPTAEQMRIALETLAELKDEKRGRIAVVIGDPLKVLVDAGYRRQFKQYLGTPFCLGCTSCVADGSVDVYGNLKGCLHSVTSHGNVRDEPLMELWRKSPLMRALRDRSNLGGRCGRCHYRQICGGCRETANLVGGSFLAEDPLCWLPEDAVGADLDRAAGKGDP